MARARTPNLRPIRQDTWRIEVSIEHPFSGATIPLGVWDKKTGGAVDSEDNKYYPGSMVDPISLGGRRTVDNLTVTRGMRIERDWGLIQTLYDAAGRSRMFASIKPLDTDGSNDPSVKPMVYNGTLKRVGPPDIDSEASGAVQIELEMIVEGFPTAT